MANTLREFRKNPDLADNFTVDKANGTVTFKATVSADADAVELRNHLVDAVNESVDSVVVGDARLEVELSRHIGNGRGDLHVATRDTLKQISPESFEGNWSFCSTACAETGGNNIYIGRSNLSGGKLTHEIFHTMGFRGHASSRSDVMYDSFKGIIETRVIS